MPISVKNALGETVSLSTPEELLALLATQATLAAFVAANHTDLAAILAKQPATPALDGADINAPTAMPAGGVGTRGWLSSIWTKLNGSLAVTGTFFQGTQPVSAAALPLPVGAAAEATLSAMSGKLPSAVGQKTQALSFPVCLSSDGPFSTKFGPQVIAAAQHAEGAAGAAVTKTLAAAGAGVSNVIEGWGVSMSGNPAAAVTLTISDGATVILKEYIISGGPTGPMLFPRPIKGSANATMTGTLSAPGSTIVGIVTFYGARTE